MQQRLLKVLPLLLLAAAGIGISLTIEDIHRELEANPIFVSFCSINARIDCNVVLGSVYAKLGGVSVSLWGLLYYVGMLVLGIVGASRERVSEAKTIANLLFAGSIFGFIFSLYMAVIAFGVLHTLCLLCASLYVVSLLQFVFAWRYRRSFEQLGGKKVVPSNSQQDRWVMAGSLLAGLLLSLGALWEAVLAPGAHAETAADVERLHPDFAKWFREQPKVDVSTEGGLSIGDANAASTIVVFSDFGCPHCAAFDRAVEKVLRERVTKDIRVIHRNFPLDNECNSAMTASIHPGACLAAAATECAADQGKFWPYHRQLFDSQNHFKRSELVSYAENVGLDRAAFERCLDGSEAKERVQRDIQEALRLKIQSTPTFFLDGRRFDGGLDPEKLSSALILSAATK